MPMPPSNAGPPESTNGSPPPPQTPEALLANYAMDMCQRGAVASLALLEGAKRHLKALAEGELDERARKLKEESKKLKDDERRIQDEEKRLANERALLGQSKAAAAPRVRTPRVEGASRDELTVIETRTLSFISTLSKETAMSCSAVSGGVSLVGPDPVSSAEVSDAVRKLLRLNLIHQEGLRRGARYYGVTPADKETVLPPKQPELFTE